MLKTQNEDIPDPDRLGDKDVIESRDAPIVFQQDNSEDSDDQDDSNHGYEMINQDDEGEEEEEEEVEEDQETSRETELADLVRAAQADPENLTETTREMIDRASEAQRAEELAESAKVWTDADSEPRGSSIELNDEKIETIKSIMSGVKLKTVPTWTNDLDALKGKILNSSEKPN